jgi:SAM-dependent methyltransferase
LSIHMLENSNSDIDVERIMHEIRATVSREYRTGSEDSSSSPGQISNSDDAPDSLRLQPVFQPKHDREYHVNDLLKFHGEEFVRNSYRALLLREPDQSGLAHHVEGLASGRFNKIDVLASLHASPEGRRAQVRIAGLSMPATVRRLGRIPLIGYLIRLMIAVVRLPFLLDNQRQFEFYVQSHQQRIVAHQNQRHRELSGALAEMLERIERSTQEQKQLIAQHIEEQKQLNARQIEEQQQFIAQQSESEKTITSRFAETREFVDGWTKELNERIASQRQELLHQQQTFIQQQEAQRQDLVGKQQELNSEMQQLLLRQEKANDKLTMQQRELTTQRRGLAGLLEEVSRNGSAIYTPSLTQRNSKEEDRLLDALYASFEDKFRGERDEIRQRLEVYVPALRDAGIIGDVLDVACGRGEWLQLLNDEGIQARGVDHNRIFVEECRRGGLDVVEEDALVHLRSLSAESLNTVTAFHLVEHLEFEVLIKLLDESIRILRRGGLLIIETPNPENFMVGSYSFYTDPTHRNPIPSQTLQFLLESRGLASINVMKLRPWDAAKIEGDSEIIKRFNEYFYSAPDYGIVARKP